MTLYPDPLAAEFAPFGDWSTPGPATGVAALIEDQHGRILMQLRDDIPTIAAPGLWCFPGGGVEPGEALESAMRRELAEETGLSLGPGVLRPFHRVVTVEHRRTRLYVFRTAMSIAPERLVIGEGAGMALLTPAQIAAYPVVMPIAALVAAHFSSNAA
ncbi:MAG: NUDIX domain-containing protein [Pseudomonadota bacterium]